MKEKVRYIKYILVHPFDGFYEAKYRGKGSYIIAVILMLAYCVLTCVGYQYTGFIMNNNPLYAMNSFTIFISNLSVMLLFILANYTVTTLFDGKGGMKDILLVLSYSLVPVIITNIISIIVSNYVILEEAILLIAFQYIGILWFAFLLISGLCVIHEYHLLQNFVTLIATLISAVIIIFLFVLLISLVEQMISFFFIIIGEAFRRI